MGLKDSDYKTTAKDGGGIVLVSTIGEDIGALEEKLRELENKLDFALIPLQEEKQPMNSVGHPTSVVNESRMVTLLKGIRLNIQILNKNISSIIDRINL